MVIAHQAAVQNPDPVGDAIAALHRLDDFFERGRVIAIAGEHFVPEREPFAGDHQREIDLFAVWSVIAGIAAVRLGIAPGLAFKIGRRDIVEQQLILHRKQTPQARFEMLRQRILVRQEMIERTVETIIIDFGRRYPQ